MLGLRGEKVGGKGRSGRVCVGRERRSYKNRVGAGEGMSSYLCKPFVAVDCKTRQDSLE